MGYVLCTKKFQMRIFKMKSISIKETIKEYAGIIIALKKI